jgi:hypothetical protein
LHPRGETKKNYFARDESKEKIITGKKQRLIYPNFLD